MELSTEGHGYGMNSGALFSVDIPLPDVSKPHGKAKFLERSAPGKEDIELGYIINVSVNNLDVSKIPEKYRKPRQGEGDWVIEPIEQVVYVAHFDFSLKDADGFVLMSASSEPVYLYSGKHVFQGTTRQAIPVAVAKRTKSILTNMTVEKCETCF